VYTTDSAADGTPSGRGETQSGAIRNEEDIAMTLKRFVSTASTFATIWLVAGAATVLAQDSALPAGFKTQPLLKSIQTRDKQPIAYPKTDTPEMISVIGIIEPGGRTPLHEHPVPTYVYVLEGEVELQSHGGQPHQYKAGEAYIEALNHQHQLFNRGNVPAKVLVVFVGEEGKPTTITAK
jgi:quercetin dioxygenase-like cupin family protein